MKDIAITLITTTVFLLSGIAMLVAVASLTFFYVRHRIQNRRAMMCQLGHSMGLAIQENGGMPVLVGQVDGVDVIIDVTYQSYIRPGPGNRPGVRSWTRVRAKLPVARPIHVRSRHQKLDDKTPDHLLGWSLRTTGDDGFDQHFELFVDDEVANFVALSTHQRNALLNSKSVHVRKGAAEWLFLNMPKDIAAFEHAVLSCVRVAASFGQASPSARNSQLHFPAKANITDTKSGFQNQTDASPPINRSGIKL